MREDERRDREEKKEREVMETNNDFLAHNRGSLQEEPAFKQFSFFS